MTNLLQQLSFIRGQIATFEATEADIVKKIIEANKHTHVGAKTYDFEGKSVTITTKEIVALDKNLLNSLWEEWMPINRGYSYSARTKELEVAMASAPPDRRKLLASIVTTKPAKPVVQIKDKS